MFDEIKVKISFTLVQLEHTLHGRTVKSRITCGETEDLMIGVNRIWNPSGITFEISNCQTRKGVAPVDDEEFFQDEDEDLSHTEELFLEEAWRDKKAHVNVYIVPMIVNTDVLGAAMKKSTRDNARNELRYIILSEYSSYSGGEALSRMKLEYILAHELGHCLNVEHPDGKATPNSLMSAYNNPELTQEYLSPEEISTAREYAKNMKPFDEEKTQVQMLKTTWVSGENRNYKSLGSIRRMP